jgi:hypothetical protein
MPDPFDELKAKIAQILVDYEQEHDRIVGCFLTDSSFTVEDEYPHHEFDGEKFSHETYLLTKY